MEVNDHKKIPEEEELARLLYEKFCSDELEEVIELCNQLIGENPQKNLLHYYRGMALVNRGQPAKALFDFEAALSINRSAEIYLNQGIAFLTLERYEDALRSLSEAINLNSDLARAYMIKGDILKKTGRREDALNSYFEVLRIEPENVEALYSSGIILQNTGLFEDALIAFTKAARINPQNQNLFLNRAIVYNSLGQYNTAIRDLELAREIAPIEEPKFIQLHASCLFELQNYQDALVEIDKAIQIEPSLDRYIIRGRILLFFREYESAIRMAEKALQIEPESEIAYDLKGLAYIGQDKLTDALQSFKLALQNPPNRPTTHANLGFLLESVNPPAAIESFHTSIALNLRDKQFPRILLKLYNHSRSPLLVLNRLFENPHLLSGIEFYSAAQNLLIEYRDAIKLYSLIQNSDSSIASNIDMSEKLKVSALIMLNGGDEQKAADGFRELYKQYPLEWFARYYLVEANKGIEITVPELTEFLDSARALIAQKNSLEGLYYASLLLLHYGDGKDLNILKERLITNKSTPWLRFLYASICDSMGDNLSRDQEFAQIFQDIKKNDEEIHLIVDFLYKKELLSILKKFREWKNRKQNLNSIVEPMLDLKQMTPLISTVIYKKKGLLELLSAEKSVDSHFIEQLLNRTLQETPSFSTLLQEHSYSIVENTVAGFIGNKEYTAETLRNMIFLLFFKSRISPQQVLALFSYLIFTDNFRSDFSNMSSTERRLRNWLLIPMLSGAVHGSITLGLASLAGATIAGIAAVVAISATAEILKDLAYLNDIPSYSVFKSKQLPFVSKEHDILLEYLHNLRIE